MPLLRHLFVAAIAAVFLTWVRGGFRDDPSVLFFFGLIGFLASLALSVVLRAASQDWIDSRLGRSSRAVVIRYSAALIGLVAVFFVTAPVVLRAGAAGWMVLVLFAVLFTLVLCLLAPGWHLAWAPVIATVLIASLWRHNLRRPWGEVPDPLSVAPEYLGLWFMALVLAGLVAVPRYLHLRTVPRRSRASGIAAGGVRDRV